MTLGGISSTQVPMPAAAQHASGEPTPIAVSVTRPVKALFRDDVVPGFVAVAA